MIAVEGLVKGVDLRRPHAFSSCISCIDAFCFMTSRNSKKHGQQSFPLTFPTLRRLYAQNRVCHSVQDLERIVVQLPTNL